MNEIIRDCRVEQARKIIESLVSKSMFDASDILLTSDNKVIIILDKTVMYCVELKDMIDSYPLISFNYKSICNFEDMNYCTNNIFMAQDINNLYLNYMNCISNLQPCASNNDLRLDDNFEKLLQLKAADGMKYYHMIGNDMKNYMVPIFSGFPNLSKQDKIGINIYDLQNGYLFIDMNIFKKKLNREIHMYYRTIKF